MSGGQGVLRGAGAVAGWTLVIESSTVRGSAALARDGVLVASTEAVLGNRDTEAMMPAVADVLAAASLEVSEICRVICGAGPGSFTGLRIGAAIGKGIAHARSIPLHAVSSLLLAGAEAADRFGDGRYLVVVDALRGERYALRTESRDGTTAADGALRLMPAELMEAEAELDQATLVGPDHGGVWPHARGVARCWHAVSQPVELGSWEPRYGRKAEAQVRWERTHGRALTDA